MNRTQVIGNIGQDATVRNLESGQAAISFSVGASERWTDAQGVKQERTEWFNCTIWRKQDKVAIAQYLKKGTKVLVEGKVTARPWTNQTGELKASLELRVDNFEFVGSAPKEESQGAPQPIQNAAPTNQAPLPESFSGNIKTDTQDDDLPF